MVEFRGCPATIIDNKVFVALLGNEDQFIIQTVGTVSFINAIFLPEVLTGIDDGVGVLIGKLPGCLPGDVLQA